MQAAKSLLIVFIVIAVASVLRFNPEVSAAEPEESAPSQAIGYVDSEGRAGIEYSGEEPAAFFGGLLTADPVRERELVVLINRYRRSHGLIPFKMDPLLTTAAQGHSTDMATNNFFSHTGSGGTTPGQRITNAGYNWSYYGETIAAGNSTTVATFGQWTQSPGHNAIMLGAGREIGTGYAYNGSSTYGHYWTADYGYRSGVYPLVINDEAGKTTSAEVTLYVHGPGGAQQMRFRNGGGSWSGWQAYNSTKSWLFATGSGLKTVYSEVTLGGSTYSASDDITLEGGTVYFVVKGTNSNIYERGMTSGGSFPSSWQRLAGLTSHAPALTVFNNRLYAAAKGSSNNNVYASSRGGGPNWTSWSKIPGLTNQSPALAAFNNRLYLAVKGAANTNIYLKSMSTSGTWDASWTTLAGLTGDSPALAFFNNKLYLAVKGAANNSIYVKSMSDTGAWSGWSVVPGASNCAPALAVFNDRLYLAVKGATNNQIYVKYMTTAGTWSASWTTVPGLTSTSPALAAMPETSRLYLAVKGAANNNIYIKYMNTAGTWSASWTSVPGLTTDTPPIRVF